jgi:hypothetical protein
MERLKGQFPMHFLAFGKKGEGDEVADYVDLVEITEVADGCVEIGMTYGRERIYLRMRRSDLMQAIKEMTP